MTAATTGLGRGIGRARWAALLILLFSAFAAAVPGRAPAQDYLLGPQDRIRMRVFEWRPSVDEVVPWAALNDEFTVGADGGLSLPLIGRVEVAGRGVEDLREAVAQGLSSRMALQAAPDIAIEIVQYRPFYVAGPVASPGAYEWRPGLTVIQAVALAGGVSLSGRDGVPRAGGVIARHADVGVLASDEVRLLARRARLLAERDGLDAVTAPDRLSGNGNASTADLALAQERDIREARRNALDAQVEALRGLRQFLEGETGSLERQIELLDRQVASVEAEFANLESLVQQGLAVASRQTALERTLLQTQSERLTAETALLRARQEQSRVDLSIIERQHNRAAEVLTELRATEADLDQVRHRRAAAMLLLAEAEGAAMAVREGDGEELISVRIRILRSEGDGTAELAAEDSTRVEPGDTIRVDVILPSLGPDPALIQ